MDAGDNVIEFRYRRSPEITVSAITVDDRPWFIPAEWLTPSADGGFIESYAIRPLSADLVEGVDYKLCAKPGEDQ